MKTEIGWGFDMPAFDCAVCGLRCEPDEPDACLGLLPGVFAACCGHGGLHGPEHGTEAYIAFDNGVTLYFDGAVNRVTPRCEVVGEWEGQPVEMVTTLATWRDAQVKLGTPEPRTGSRAPRSG